MLRVCGSGVVEEERPAHARRISFFAESRCNRAAVYCNPRLQVNFFLRNPVETELQCTVIPDYKYDLLSFVNVMLQDWVISDKGRTART